MPSMARYDPFSPTFDHPLLNSSPDFSSRNGSLRNLPIGGFLPHPHPQLQPSFRERHKKLKQSDFEKNQLIDDLLSQLEAVQNDLRVIKLEKESQGTKTSRSKEDTLRDELEHTKAIMNRNAYITALIDGDGTIFTTEFISDGEKGGKEAANQLAASILDYTTTSLSHLESPRIIVKIFANISLLADNLAKCKEIVRPELLNDFLKGFNSTKLLFDFIDVGTKRDAAGDKLSENLRVNMNDCHCQGVLLACSHNDDYAKVIQEVSADPETADRLILLEAVPFGKELAALRSNFRNVKFDGLFRSTRPAPPKAPAGVILPVIAKVDTNKTSGSNSASSTPSMNWATVTAQAPPPPTTLATPLPTPPATVTAKPATVRKISGTKMVLKPVCTNRLGQRIDKTDESIPNYEIQRVKKIKLCNAYHLQGQNCTSSLCTHRHDYPISNSERKTLREVARMTPCYYQTECEDAECIYGHRCPQSKPGESGCYYGKDCRFYGWGHGIDIRICKTVKV